MPDIVVLSSAIPSTAGKALGVRERGGLGFAGGAPAVEHDGRPAHAVDRVGDDTTVRAEARFGAPAGECPQSIVVRPQGGVRGVRCVRSQGAGAPS